MKIFKQNPLVSIIVTTFNRKELLKETIESILKQTYTNFELIVIDNYSNYIFFEFIKTFDDTRIKAFRNQNNGSVEVNRNYGIHKSKGEFIAFCDDDDLWTEKKLEIQIPLFSNPKVGLSCGESVILNERNKIIFDNYRKMLPSGYIVNFLLKDYFVHFSSLVIRRAALDGLDLFFDARFKVIGDFDLVIRLGELWEIATVQKPVTIARYHNHNTGLKLQHFMDSDLRLWINKMEGRTSITSQSNFIFIQNKADLNYIIKSIVNGEKLKALKSISKSKIECKFKYYLILFFPTIIIKKLFDYRRTSA